MIVLGWHGGIRREFEDMLPGWSTHDGAAVIVADGNLIAAVEEERLNRVKHSNFFPAEAIRSCLSMAGIDLAGVDCVAMNFAERTREIFPSDRGLPSVDLFLQDPDRRCLTVRDTVCDLFLTTFGADVASKLFFCNHHLAHLWSAWWSSAFADSLLVSLDGSGDALSGMVAVAAGGAGGDVRILREYSVAQSLGDLYSDMIRVLGYARFDEYKAMGLAPYGDPERYASLFQTFYRLLPEGQYDLASRSARWAALHEAGLVAKARRSGDPFTTVHRDFAASLQDLLETVAMHLLGHFRATTLQENICLAGGVAHNCTLNGRILYDGGFGSVFVQPAAHDAGGALGAAVAAQAAKDVSVIRTSPLAHAFWGNDVGSDADVEQALAKWRDFLTFERVTDVARHAAELLAEGRVLAWVNGRAEFGPRALGHRSILADPRYAETSARINRMVKKREAFRPFAPSICEERLDDLLDLPPTAADYSFMTFVLRVRGSARERLAAVTHIDGTARIQSVSRRTDPLYWELIHQFELITGVPAVLNTSLNNNAEPIVESVFDAIVCFLTTGLDLLVINSYVARARAVERGSPAYERLRPALPYSRKLVRRERPMGDKGCVGFSIESTASSHFGDSSIGVSADVHAVLLRSDGSRRLAELCADVAVAPGARRQALTDELVDLWGRRAITLRP